MIPGFFGDSGLELLLLGLFLGGAVFAVWWMFTGNDEPKNRGDKPKPSQRTRAAYAPFDAARAKPAPDFTTLRGSAYVVDGDTVVIDKVQIRLFGIDAPEMNHPYGKNAKWALVNLCKGQIIRAVAVAQDAHGRTVARCYLADGRDLSAEMVTQGFAIDWPKYSGGHYGPMETPDARRKMWLADARQKGRMDVWEKFDAQQKARAAGN
ncbi:nuclease homologue [Pseudorhodobacter antarcticus]|uniref:Nuclease homologue n=1 Tax=Pseudorhodobacter antarcticus TaxID=1077947 RepID=A0A1H8FP53_9RHOB|nr:nuclease homologue [Pseudorhodobacter antarcticus]